jgi:hypothetical protein
MIADYRRIKGNLLRNSKRARLRGLTLSVDNKNRGKLCLPLFEKLTDRI